MYITIVLAKLIGRSNSTAHICKTNARATYNIKNQEFVVQAML